jgi:hypothetical protein
VAWIAAGGKAGSNNRRKRRGPGENRSVLRRLRLLRLIIDVSAPSAALVEIDCSALSAALVEIDCSAPSAALVKIELLCAVCGRG